MSWNSTLIALAVALLMSLAMSRGHLSHGTRAAPLEHAYVRIENDRIAEVSASPLKGDPQIDGRGKFLIPGLIDTHMHLGQVPGMVEPHLAAHPDLAAKAKAQEPRSYLYFGFTTVLSLGDTAEPIKRWNALDRPAGRVFLRRHPDLQRLFVSRRHGDPVLPVQSGPGDVAPGLGRQGTTHARERWWSA